MKNEISNILYLIEIGDTIKALREAKSFYEKNENNLDALKLLAYSYIQVGNFEKVIYLLEKGFGSRIDKQDFDYFNNMGYALSQIEEYKESAIYLEKAIQINKKNPGVYCSLAEVYLKRKEFKKAEELILIALNIVNELGGESFTKYANIFLLLSEINAALKKDGETINLFCKILNDKFNENIFFLLANIDAGSVSKSLMKQAENNILANSNSYKNKIEKFNYVTPLYFGLAMCYQSVDKQKSEKYFNIGNKEIFDSTRYNSHQYQERIVKTMDLYVRKYKSFDESDREHGRNNFFIVGAPRSGTTLVESIVTANNNVFSGGELKSCKNIIEKNILSTEQSLSDLSHKFISKYLRRTSYLRGAHEYVVDKMPENFLYLGFIQKLLPKSKVIKIYRNPWDIAVSLFKQRYVLNIPYSVSFFNIGVFLSNFEAINLFWAKNMNNKTNILEIKYEELVSNHGEVQRDIYSFLGIDSKYDEKLRSEFFSPTASIRQVREKIHKKSVEKMEFLEHKDEFLNAFFMQREYWATKSIDRNNDDFFGYSVH